MQTAEGIEILLQLYCLYLSYWHQMKEQYDQLATCEPSNRNSVDGW